MAITPTVLENLATSVDLRIEPLNIPVTGGQPQDFQIRPPSLILGAIGDLFPIEAALSTAIPVELVVTWGVEDVEGNPLDEKEAVVCSRRDPTSPSLDRTLQATVMVLPDFVELIGDGTEVPAKARYVTASVTLTAKTRTDPTPKTTLPLLRYPITVPAIPIPTVAIFFAKPTLGVTPATGEIQAGEQYALIAVPTRSPIGGIDALRGVFDTLMRITGTANQLAGLAGFPVGALPPLVELGEGLATLLGALNAHKVVGGGIGVAFISADRVPDLNEVDTILNTHWYNDVEAEDTISSFVFIGAPGRQLRCFEDTDYEGWHLTVTTGPAGLAIVNDLMSAPPTNLWPPTTPKAVQYGTTALDDEFSAMAFM